MGQSGSVQRDLFASSMRVQSVLAIRWLQVLSEQQAARRSLGAIQSLGEDLASRRVSPAQRGYSAGCMQRSGAVRTACRATSSSMPEQVLSFPSSGLPASSLYPASSLMPASSHSTRQVLVHAQIGMLTNWQTACRRYACCLSRQANFSGVPTPCSQAPARSNPPAGPYDVRAHLLASPTHCTPCAYYRAPPAASLRFAAGSLNARRVCVRSVCVCVCTARQSAGIERCKPSAASRRLGCVLMFAFLSAAPAPV